MPHFKSSGSSKGLHVKLWRGERLVLIGMNVDTPEPDFVGFCIEVKSPGKRTYSKLRNRIAFSYAGHAGTRGAEAAVNGFRNFPSDEAPFQKFRWMHFPYEPKDGEYCYRVTKRHMDGDGTLRSGAAVTVAIWYEATCYDGFLQIGFTRGYASSQAFVDLFEKDGVVPPVIPPSGASGLSFTKMSGRIYEWMGYEAYRLLFDTLREVQDPAYTLDFFAYDLNERDIVSHLESLGSRLRAVLDNSAEHGKADSDETEAAKRLAASAGAGHVLRTHFQGLQHNKVLIVKKHGEPCKVLLGSTNFSYRGLYIQANNMLVFEAKPIVQLFCDYFEIVFADPSSYEGSAFASEWHDFNTTHRPGVSVCLSPHADPELSLGRVAEAIRDAQSSVFFAIAFLSTTTSGAVRSAIDALQQRPLFSYGISDKDGGLDITKPDGSVSIVDFAYLKQHAPEPFKAEWSGGSGIQEHNKFVVVDFNLPTARVFTGSSNLSPSGEGKNGDNLVCIRDERVATAYALEALRIFDHLQFRAKMQEAGAPDEIVLKRPTALSGQPAWFESSYIAGSQAERDRLLFSR